ncbi:hypothetical protein [Nocardioides soli]|uniref:Uncharacterized protein n=1 Tax=Nocardioides soli TaxID=1036020 RepID=A0A7W4VYE5_9ACTN|nr:hypothetical protein [Nocardioides soli]MBB3043587.1 hypothetical protein [Nocardioides soli]
MRNTPRHHPTPEQARLIERGLAGVAQFEAEEGAFTEEELAEARALIAADRGDPVDR